MASPYRSPLHTRETALLPHPSAPRRLCSPLWNSSHLSFPTKTACYSPRSGPSFSSPATRHLRFLLSSSSIRAATALAMGLSHAVSALVSILKHGSRPREPIDSTPMFADVDMVEFYNGSRADGKFPRVFSEQGGLAMALLSTTAIAKDQISPVIATLCANPTFMSGLVTWAIAQILKVFTTFFVERKWDWKMMFGSGGMPSSHSALCMALTTSVAVCHGINDALFPVCLGFSLIVMYDAAGVRRHAGMQAEVLNMIVEDLFKGHPLSEKKLKELLGHTPLQVAAGAILGIVAGYLCSQGSSSFPGRILQN